MSPGDKEIELPSAKETLLTYIASIRDDIGARFDRHEARYQQSMDKYHGDHEVRIRSLEEFKAKALGALLLASILGSALGAGLMRLITR